MKQEAKNKNESEQVKIKERNYSVTCSNENSDLTIDEEKHTEYADNVNL